MKRRTYGSVDDGSIWLLKFFSVLSSSTILSLMQLLVVGVVMCLSIIIHDACDYNDFLGCVWQSNALLLALTAATQIDKMICNTKTRQINIFLCSTLLEFMTTSREFIALRMKFSPPLNGFSLCRSSSCLTEHNFSCHKSICLEMFVHSCWDSWSFIRSWKSLIDASSFMIATVHFLLCRKN